MPAGSDAAQPAESLRTTTTLGRVSPGGTRS
jgi:hypothetical protein